jgi:hypothetical protein
MTVPLGSGVAGSKLTGGGSGCWPLPREAEAKSPAINATKRKDLRMAGMATSLRAIPISIGTLRRVAQTLPDLKPSFRRLPGQTPLFGVESLHQLLETAAKTAAGGVHVVTLGDHLHSVISIEPLAAEHPFKGRSVRAVGNQ